MSDCHKQSDIFFALKSALLSQKYYFCHLKYKGLGNFKKRLLNLNLQSCKKETAVILFWHKF